MKFMRGCEAGGALWGNQPGRMLGRGGDAGWARVLLIPSPASPLCGPVCPPGPPLPPASPPLAHNRRSVHATFDSGLAPDSCGLPSDRPTVAPPPCMSPPAPTSPRGHAHGAANMALAPSGGRAAYTTSAEFSYVLAVFDVNDLSKQPSCESGTSSRIREGRRSRAPSFIAQLIMF